MWSIVGDIVKTLLIKHRKNPGIYIVVVFLAIYGVAYLVKTIEARQIEMITTIVSTSMAAHKTEEEKNNQYQEKKLEILEKKLKPLQRMQRQLSRIETKLGIPPERNFYGPGDE